MLFRDISILDETFSVQEHMNVGIRGKRIAYLHTELPKEDFGEVYDGKNRLLLPAFVNLHSHLPMVYLRGYGDHLPLMEWLNTKIFPFEAKMTDDDMYYGTLAGIAEMLRFGIASTTEMYLSLRPLCRAFLDSGAKANVSRCVSCFDPAVSFADMPQHKELKSCFSEFHGAEDDRIRVEASIHSEYTTTEKTVRGIAETAKELGTSLHVHVSETEGEVFGCRERHGKSPVEYLAACGVFDVPTTAAHCVWTDENDRNILREKGVSVAANPKSNAKLASGVSPVADYLARGINVGIGTDSVSSNNNLNMLEEMRFFNLLQKGITREATVITPAETVYAATRAGALAQRRTDCGLIKEGFRADLTVFDIDRVYMKPTHDLLHNLVYSAQGTDVVLTMADGTVLYRDGEYPTLDIERIFFEVEQRKNRILSEL